MPNLHQRLTAALVPPRVKPYSEQGVSGTSVQSGYVQRREKSAEWSGSQRYITIADMAVNASIVAAGLHYFVNLIAHPRWAFEPADKSGEAKEVAEFVEEVLNDTTMPWSRVVRRAAMYRFYGFGVQEWTAKRRLDNRVGLASIEPRPQHSIERWSTDPSGAVTGVWQRDPATGAELGIPRKKILYLVDDTVSDSPEGIGIFRHLASPWSRLQTYYTLETRAFERDLRGIPIGRIPYSVINAAVKDGVLTEERANQLTKAMEDFVKVAIKQSDTGLLIDSVPYESEAADGRKISGVQQWGLELLQGSGNGMTELADAIKRTQYEMARVMTCQSLLMGEESGNRALSEDMSRNLYLVSNAVLGDIVAGVEQDIVPVICMLNGIPEELYPKCAAEDVAAKDAEGVARVLRDMSTAGAVLSPDDPVIADVRSLMGVSPPAPVSPEMMGLSTDEEDEDEAEEAVEEVSADEEAPEAEDEEAEVEGVAKASAPVRKIVRRRSTRR